jgi:multidrug resistance efflux pump
LDLTETSPQAIDTNPPPRAKRGKALGVVILLLLAVGGVAGGAEAYTWYKNHQPILITSAQLVGDVDEVTVDVPGEVDHVLVRPGDLVRPGTLLATLKNPALAAELQSAQKDDQEAQLAAASTQAQPLPPSLSGSMPALPRRPLPPVSSLPSAAPAPNPANTHLQADDSSSKRAVDTQQLIADQAGAALKSAQADADAAKSQLDSVSAPVESLQSNLDLAKTQRDKFKGLYGDGIISRKEFEVKQAAVDSAQAAVDDAQKTVKDATDAVTQATAALQAANVSNALVSKKLADLTAHYNHVHGLLAAMPAATTPAPGAVLIPPMPRVTMPPPLGFANGPASQPHGLSPMRVDFDQPKHDQAQTHLQAVAERLATAQAQVKALALAAPGEGVVVAVNLKLGQLVSELHKIAVTVAHPTTFHVLATVPHDQALRLKKGMFCSVTISTLPKVVFPGTVTGFLSPGSQLQPALVEIGLDSPATLLLEQPPGTRVSVEVRPI